MNIHTAPIEDQVRYVLFKLADAGDAGVPVGGGYLPRDGAREVMRQKLGEAERGILYILPKGHKWISRNASMSMDIAGELVRLARSIVAEDVISVDVPLFIRLLEYAKEDAKTDMDLHKVTENVLKSSGKTLTMDDYDRIVAVGKGKKAGGRTAEIEDLSDRELENYYFEIQAAAEKSRGNLTAKQGVPDGAYYLFQQITMRINAPRARWRKVLNEGLYVVKRNMLFTQDETTGRLKKVESPTGREQFNFLDFENHQVVNFLDESQKWEPSD